MIEYYWSDRVLQIGRAPAGTLVTYARLVGRLLLEKNTGVIEYYWSDRVLLE